MGPADDMQAIHENHAAERRRIATHTEWTPAARRVAQARAWVRAADATAALQDSYTTRVRALRADLTKKLFGHPAGGHDTLSVRDAHDRAAQLTTADDATALLDRATLLGDEHLARAVAHHAATLFRDPGWRAVVDHYAETRPTAAATIARLAELPHLDEPITRMRVAQTFTAPKPAGLDQLSDQQIRTIADTEIPHLDGAA